MDNVVQWLLEGDVSIQYLTHRYLLESDADVLLRLQSRIAREGYGAAYLARQNDNGTGESGTISQMDVHALHAPRLKKIGLPCR
jgi:hypothetical protein